jgi:hypothetical protein
MIRIALATLLRLSAVVASGELAAKRGGVRLERVGLGDHRAHALEPIQDLTSGLGPPVSHAAPSALSSSRAPVGATLFGTIGSRDEARMRGG